MTQEPTPDASVAGPPPHHGRCELRVLHVDEQRGWRGGEQQMLYLAGGLQRRGHAAALVVQPGSPAGRRALDAGVPVHEVRMRGEADFGAALRIARIARSGGFNILHAHTAHAHALIQLAAHFWRCGCRVVAHRRIEFAVGRRAFGLGRLKYRFGVDAYIAVSDRVKETLIAAGVPEWRVFSIHSGTQPERFAGAEPLPRSELQMPDDAFVLGTVGALVGHKDHRNLLEAARVVRDHIPETWVVIVGGGPLRQSILDKAERLHMADRLVLTGFRWDVPRLLRAFDVFVISSSEEGICGSVIDAAAAGLPVVTTDAGGIREAILAEETGIVVPVRSPRSLAQGILRLASDAKDTRRMVEAGRRRVAEHFSVDVMTDKTIQVYERVLRGEIGPDRPVGFCTR